MNQHSAVPDQPTAESATAYLELTRLIDELEVSNPELSGPLRLTLLRARRHHSIMWLDSARFRAVVDQLLDQLDDQLAA